MDFSFWVAILVVIGSIVYDHTKKGRREPPGSTGPLPRRPVPPRRRQAERPRINMPPVEIPMPQPTGRQDSGLGFEVPHIEGAPPATPQPPVQVQGADGAWHEAGSQLAEEMEALEEARRDREQDLARETRERVLRAEEEAAYAVQAKLVINPVRHTALGLTPEQALSAVALAEILGKPKALQGRKCR